MTTSPRCPRRPRLSNSPLAIVRGIRILKTIYWTTSRLRKLLPKVFSMEREDHFDELWRSGPLLRIEFLQVRTSWEA